MHYKGSIRAVNLQISQAIANNCSDTWPGKFAFDKLASKFEVPDRSSATARRTDAWERWIGSDEGLRQRGLLGPHWAEARLKVRNILSDFRMGALTFTDGSTFEPLGPRTSIACKLTGPWTVTPDCFDTFAAYAYRHRVLKSAVKKRFKSYCIRRNWCEKVVNRKLWKRFRKDTPFEAFRFKLFCTCVFVQGNRWSTVPKNNLKDRSICLEPLCNMLVQRAIGLGIRECLRSKLGIDLDNLAEKHRYRIRDKNIATIDLSDCSDTISMSLVKYLLPYPILRKIEISRSPMTLGPDDNFYVVNKVSSMGNGFTFDLMSLILTALSRTYDCTSTVFGDDIICQNQVADDLCRDLELGGFRVNHSKTCINSEYRESCGAHFVDGKGYLTVFDLRWLETPHDLVVALNKVAILSSVYGGPFETLRKGLWDCVTPALLGAATQRHVAYTGGQPKYDLDTFVRYGPRLDVDVPDKLLRPLRRKCRDLQKTGRLSIGIAFTAVTPSSKDSLKSSDWDLFYQYIHNSRRSPRVNRSAYKSTLVARVDEEQIGLVDALLP